MSFYPPTNSAVPNPLDGFEGPRRSVKREGKERILFSELSQTSLEAANRVHSNSCARIRDFIIIDIAGAFGIVVRDPGYPNRPLFNLDVGVACPSTFSVDFTIPTEGPDNYDKTLLVDISDSYRTIKVTIFRPAPNMTAEAYGKSCYKVIVVISTRSSVMLMFMYLGFKLPEFCI